MKTLIIKTKANTIYVANGKVTIVRDNTTGRFVKPAKFANIVNNLVAAAKAAANAPRNNNPLATHTATTKALIAKFANLSNMAKKLLGELTVYLAPRHAQGLSALQYA